MDGSFRYSSEFLPRFEVAPYSIFVPRLTAFPYGAPVFSAIGTSVMWPHGHVIVRFKGYGDVAGVFRG